MKNLNSNIYKIRIVLKIIARVIKMFTNLCGNKKYLLPFFFGSTILSKCLTIMPKISNYLSNLFNLKTWLAPICLLDS